MADKDKYENVGEALAYIQQHIKAPKSRENKFGGYKYRAQEDILEAVKPLLMNGTLRVQDEIVEIGGRIYVKATASLVVGSDRVDNVAYAREPENKKGMDESQITGAASSYARKYALNGLFLIDDTQDADATNDHDKNPTTVHPMDKTGNRATDKWVNNAVADLNACTTLLQLKNTYTKFYKQAQEKKCTEDQLGMLEMQKDAVKSRLEIEDEIPDLPPHQAAHLNEIVNGKDH